MWVRPLSSADSVLDGSLACPVDQPSYDDIVWKDLSYQLCFFFRFFEFASQFPGSVVGPSVGPARHFFILNKISELPRDDVAKFGEKEIETSSSLITRVAFY